MKIAIVGSRSVTVENIGAYIADAEEIVSGGAVPIVRNKQIVDYADHVVAFWDGNSKGTLSVINYAKKAGKPCDVILCK